MPDPVLLKIVVSIVVVLGLTLLAERSSTRLAGILMSGPTGGPIVLFFLGFENGTGFAVESASWAIAGLCAQVFFIFGYFLLLKSRFSLVLSPISALLSFVIAAAFARQLPEGILIPSALLAILIAASIFAYRNVSVKNISHPKSFSGVTVVLKAVAVTALVLVVTGLDSFLGSEWSGILTIFPITSTIILMSTHIEYSREHVLTLIKEYPVGMAGMFVYLLGVIIFYDTFGLYIGTLLSYALSIAYFFIYEMFRERLRPILHGA